MATSTPVPRIFVSHSSADSTFAERLVSELRRAGAEAWIYEGDSTAGNIIARIDQMLATCDWLVLVLSPDAIASSYVQTEVYVALNRVHQGHMRGVVPITARTFPPATLTPVWASLRRFDATSDYRAALAGLLGALGLTVPQEPQDRVASAVTTPPRTPAPSQKGPAVLPGTPAPRIGVAPQLVPPVPPRLRDLGFAGRAINDREAITPPLGTVPAGSFLMGSDKRKDQQASDDEVPQHTVTLAAYQIARYPVTVAEYACFVRAGQTQPDRWSAQLQKLDHPVVYVSWHDALAYATWLAKLTGQPWRLPTEAEWEKAARGTDGRIYPWGNQWDRARANTIEGGPDTTTPVGSYPTGVSPYGAQDMAGNVWEWCSSLFQSYPYRTNDGRENPNAPGYRVLRGGAWDYLPQDARAAFRGVFDAAYVNDHGGFRLICAAPGSA